MFLRHDCWFWCRRGGWRRRRPQKVRMHTHTRIRNDERMPQTFIHAYEDIHIFSVHVTLSIELKTKLLPHVYAWSVCLWLTPHSEPAICPVSTTAQLPYRHIGLSDHQIEHMVSVQCESGANVLCVCGVHVLLWRQTLQQAKELHEKKIAEAAARGELMMHRRPHTPAVFNARIHTYYCSLHRLLRIAHRAFCCYHDWQQICVSQVKITSTRWSTQFWNPWWDMAVMWMHSVFVVDVFLRRHYERTRTVLSMQTFPQQNELMAQVVTRREKKYDDV